MRVLAGAILALFFCLRTSAEPVIPDFPKVRYSPNPFYLSEGFRLGYIIDVKWEGILIWTYEGQMALGFGTGPDQIVDHFCMDEKMTSINKIKNADDKAVALQQANQDCVIFNNPWNFSFMTSSLYTQYKRLGYVPVVIYYARPTISPWQLVTRTSNYVHAIYPTNPDLPVATHYELGEISMPLARHINPEAGFLPGRIVKASLDHALFKTYEVTIQEGVNGNNFSKMSVNNSEMFDHIVEAMLTGRLLRIGFVKLFDVEGKLASVRGYDTYYRVTSIDLIEGAPPGGPPLTAH